MRIIKEGHSKDSQFLNKPTRSTPPIVQSKWETVHKRGFFYFKMWKNIIICLIYMYFFIIKKKTSDDCIAKK